MTREQWVSLLEIDLTPLYTPPACIGGHDINHVTRMVRQAVRIATTLGDGLGCDIWVLIAAVWLHNIDRVHKIHERIAHPDQTIYQGNLWKMVLEFLRDSPFGEEERTVIADAVVQHSKRDDEPEDSAVLKWLRVCDKLDRLNHTNPEATGAHLQGRISYNPQRPWFHQNQINPRATQYTVQFTVLQWPMMMPMEARQFINVPRLRDYIAHLRGFAEVIAAHLVIANAVEQDLRLAIGDRYYQVLAGNKPVPERWWVA